LIVAAVITALAANAYAAEKRARLTINVTAQGSYHTQARVGRNYADGKFSESYGIVTYFKSNGEPDAYNTKDPTYGAKMMRRADQPRAAVARAQGKAPPKKMSPQEFQALVKQKQAACKGDRQCLTQVGMDASKMMQNVDTTGGQPAAAAGADEQAYDANKDPEPRYLSYFGYDNCGGSTYAKVDRTSSGAYDDVQGLVPWSEKEHADYKGDPIQLRLLCNAGSPVVDIKTHEVWGLQLAVGSAKGSSERIDNGRVQSSGDDVKYGYGLEWVNEQLQSHQPAGSRTVTQKMETPGGGHRNLGTTTGTATITATWKFEEVAN
jgi:hypothetical protein